MEGNHPHQQRISVSDRVVFIDVRERIKGERGEREMVRVRESEK